MTSKGLFQPKLCGDYAILFNSRKAQQAAFVIEETTLIENLSMPKRIGPSSK